MEPNYYHPVVYIIGLPIGIWIMVCWFSGINVLCEWIDEKFGGDYMGLPYFTAGVFGPFVVAALITKNIHFIWIGMLCQLALGVVPGTRGCIYFVKEWRKGKR